MPGAIFSLFPHQELEFSSFPLGFAPFLHCSCGWDLIPAIHLTWRAQLWPVLRRFFDFFPTEEGPLTHAVPWRPLRPGSACPARPGWVCSPAGLDGFPAQILCPCELWVSPGVGKASWGSHLWSHTGSHRGPILARAHGHGGALLRPGHTVTHTSLPLFSINI